MSLRQAFKEFNCDKAHHGYDVIYDQVIKDGDHILEIGVFRGESLKAFLKYYPSSKITVVDTFERVGPEDLPVLNNPRVTWIKGKSEEVVLEDLFDVIIDDGCHTHKCQIETFKNLIQYLKTGGSYFIEDVWPFDKMTPEEKEHDWLKGKDFSDQLYEKLKYEIKGYDRHFHDLRPASHKPDSYLIEVIK